MGEVWWCGWWSAHSTSLLSFQLMDAFMVPALEWMHMHTHRVLDVIWTSLTETQLTVTCKGLKPDPLEDPLCETGRKAFLSFSHLRNVHVFKGCHTLPHLIFLSISQVSSAFNHELMSCWGIIQCHFSHCFPHMQLPWVKPLTIYSHFIISRQWPQPA